ncbi:chorismate mutase [Caulobacter sp. HMWF025]|uniref:chorismate mutase n=3 Tax=unclassified Caulobacter TaxID=2648921 RepID=UPI000D34A8D2|nr:chorismate mutase [Caulobacter sp. HMWF025]PTT05358.1 chorismate mutase [Caulobacter sp. HMWF025]
MGSDAADTPPSLDEVRWRLDAIDGELLKLLDERAALASSVAAAKQAAGDTGFGLRPGREAMIVRKLLATPRKAANDALVIRIWREVMSDNLARQGPYHLSVWGGRDTARAVELTRLRFGTAPRMQVLADAKDALAAARTPWGVAVLALAPDSAWWARLLAEPRLKVFAALPCLNRWGPQAALAVAEVEVEPTGADQTFWVTDSPRPAAAIAEALSLDGVAAELIAESGGLKLFSLSGFFMAGDERLARAPGQLSGIIGAAPTPFDV